MGDEIVAQALEVARVEAEAELAQTETGAAMAEASAEAAREQANATIVAAETATEIAEIQAQRDIEVARISSEAPHGCDAGCEYCSTRFRELEQRLSEHERSMGERMVKLELRARGPEQQEVKKIKVQKPFEKPRPKRPPAQVNGGLYFGR